MHQAVADFFKIRSCVGVQTINLKGVTHTSSMGLTGMICGWGGVDVAVSMQSIAADRAPCSLSLEEPGSTWSRPSDLIGHHKQQPPPPQHGKPIQEKKRWVVLKITVIYGAVTKYGAITKEEEMLEAPTTGRRRHQSRRHSPGRRSRTRETIVCIGKTAMRHTRGE